MPLVKIDDEEKRRIVDVAMAASRAQSGRSKSKLSPDLAMHRALGRYTLFRRADDHEILGGVMLYPDEMAEIGASNDDISSGAVSRRTRR